MRWSNGLPAAPPPVFLIPLQNLNSKWIGVREQLIGHRIPKNIGDNSSQTAWEWAEEWPLGPEKQEVRAIVPKAS